MNSTITFVHGDTAVKVGSVQQVQQARMIAEIARIDADMAALKERRANLVSDFGQDYGTGKTVVPGFGEIVISENNVYDAKVMTDALKPGQFMRVSERKLVPARVKALYPSIYESSRKSNGYTGRGAKVYNG